MATNRVFTPEMLKLATQVVQSPIRRLVRGEDELTGSTVLMAIHHNGRLTVLAEHIISDSRGPKPDCECDEGHSIAKLGHSRDCPWYRTDQLTTVQPELLRGSIGCPPRHADGSPHNFSWATYADERTSTGVCVCGTSSLSWSLWSMP